MSLAAYILDFGRFERHLADVFAVLIRMFFDGQFILSDRIFQRSGTGTVVVKEPCILYILYAYIYPSPLQLVTILNILNIKHYKRLLLEKTFKKIKVSLCFYICLFSSCIDCIYKHIADTHYKRLFA